MPIPSNQHMITTGTETERGDKKQAQNIVLCPFPPASLNKEIISINFCVIHMQGFQCLLVDAKFYYCIFIPPNGINYVQIMQIGM